VSADPLGAVASVARSSPRQTFVLIPLITVAAELLGRRRRRVRSEWLLLCALGYALYRGAGEYRRAERAGPPGFERPPDRLVTTGPYALSRNPMYVWHLLFLSGLALATGSPVAVVGLLWQSRRLASRVAVDEERLERIFGQEYRDYKERVPRWLPVASA
jgi:protein-S-isoprenylcysteine O-methyltransferase Ste14